MTSEPDIVIIGAGAAGIGAARRLAGSGLSTVVLEALPRPGGRGFTREISGMAIDLGCGWLHSADRNPWVGIAEELGIAIDRRQNAWGSQYQDLGFPPSDHIAAQTEFGAWSERITDAPPANDIAADALDPNGRWTNYVQALSGYISGDELERISAKDYAAYDEASTEYNWRAPNGYGALITAALPQNQALHLATRVEGISLDGSRATLETSAGTLRPRAVIITCSTNVLSGSTIRWPSALDPWREAASRLPLGNNEKIYLEITGDSPFEPETHLIGDPRDATTGSYYIMPLGLPVIECFLGGAGARKAATDGAAAAYERATDQIVKLFGSSVRDNLRPLAASDWAGTASVGGGYSHALPSQRDARDILARPFDNRLFFAGEATHATDFSTAHGAYKSGRRAAEEAIAALTADISGAVAG